MRQAELLPDPRWPWVAAIALASGPGDDDDEDEDDPNTGGSGGNIDPEEDEGYDDEDDEDDDEEPLQVAPFGEGHASPTRRQEGESLSKIFTRLEVILFICGRDHCRGLGYS
jgi:hypothetical protein